MASFRCASTQLADAGQKCFSSFSAVHITTTVSASSRNRCHCTISSRYVINWLSQHNSALTRQLRHLLPLQPLFSTYDELRGGETHDTPSSRLPAIVCARCSYCLFVSYLHRAGVCYAIVRGMVTTRASIRCSVSAETGCLLPVIIRYRFVNGMGVVNRRRPRHCARSKTRRSVKRDVAVTVDICARQWRPVTPGCNCVMLPMRRRLFRRRTATGPPTAAFCSARSVASAAARVELRADRIPAVI